MKTTLLSTMLLLTTHMCMNAQNLIALQHGGTPTFYTLLNDAVVNAQNGDTIYIPGGTYTLSEHITKRIHFVGAGHNPDSTNITKRTRIASTFYIETGADNGSLTGVEVASHVYFYSSVNGYTISRCHVTGDVTNINAYTSQGIIIRENIIEGNCYLYASNHVITNNIFFARAGANYSAIQNNIFIKPVDASVLAADNSIIVNNIFNGNYSSTFCCQTSNSLFRNNVNCNINGSFSNGNQGSGNYDNVGALSTILVNPDFPSVVWNYNGDLHLLPGSPYHNAGTDGTDIGIYGGIFPWKEGSVPFNPYIQYKQISGTTDSNGSLNISIRVKAQDN